MGSFCTPSYTELPSSSETVAGTEILMDYLRASDLYQSLILRKGKKGKKSV